jgi:hypothetical protein
MAANNGKQGEPPCPSHPFPRLVATARRRPACRRTTNSSPARKLSSRSCACAQAATRIDVAEALLYRCVDEIEVAARSGQPMAVAKRARVRADCAWAVRQCLEAVEILYLASGGSGIAETSALGRAWRDLHAVNMHALLNLGALRPHRARTGAQHAGDLTFPGPQADGKRNPPAVLERNHAASEVSSRPFVSGSSAAAVIMTP